MRRQGFGSRRIFRENYTMNMNQLRYFIGVAEYQSFTKAAASYYITQTAITQQIRALENHLGVQLFDRNTRPVRLTPEGSVFHFSERQKRFWSVWNRRSTGSGRLPWDWWAV